MEPNRTTSLLLSELEFSDPELCKHLECPICLEMYCSGPSMDPISLSCGHTMCQTCFNSYYTNSGYRRKKCYQRCEIRYNPRTKKPVYAINETIKELATQIAGYRCPHAKLGCKFVTDGIDQEMALVQMRSHLEHCPYETHKFEWFETYLKVFQQESGEGVRRLDLERLFLEAIDFKNKMVIMDSRANNQLNQGDNNRLRVAEKKIRKIKRSAKKTQKDGIEVNSNPFLVNIDTLSNQAEKGKITKPKNSIFRHLPHSLQNRCQGILDGQNLADGSKDSNIETTFELALQGDESNERQKMTLEDINKGFLKIRTVYRSIKGPGLALLRDIEHQIDFDYDPNKETCDVPLDPRIANAGYINLRDNQLFATPRFLKYLRGKKCEFKGKVSDPKNHVEVEKRMKELLRSDSSLKDTDLVVKKSWLLRWIEKGKLKVFG